MGCEAIVDESLSGACAGRLRMGENAMPRGCKAGDTGIDASMHPPRTFCVLHGCINNTSVEKPKAIAAGSA